MKIYLYTKPGQHELKERMGIAISAASDLAKAVFILEEPINTAGGSIKIISTTSADEQYLEDIILASASNEVPELSAIVLIDVAGPDDLSVDLIQRMASDPDSCQMSSDVPVVENIFAMHRQKYGTTKLGITGSTTFPGGVSVLVMVLTPNTIPAPLGGNGSQRPTLH